MSQATRLIPKLDIKGPNLIKGIHLEGLRVLGKPEEFHPEESGPKGIEIYKNWLNNT